jgi:hypothetical protein
MWAKLTKRQVLGIRRTYAAGSLTQEQLAAKYGVSQNHISPGDAWAGRGSRHRSLRMW